MNDKRIIMMANLPLESLGKGKGGRAFITTLNAYINNGWEVYLVLANTQTSEEYRGKVHLYEKDFSEVNKPIVNNSLGRKFAKIIYTFRLEDFFYKTARSIIDSTSSNNIIVYAYEVWAVKAAKRISKRYCIPLVTRFQGTVHANTQDTIINRIKYIPHISALKCKADLIIMTNDGTQGLKTLKRLGNKSGNIKFWMNGITIPAMPTNEERLEIRNKLGFKEQFVYLTVSRLANWKKVDRAIRAFATIHKEIVNSELHIIGDGEERKKLESLSKELGISDVVVFHGSIPHNKVAEYMLCCDVFMSLYDLSNVGNPLLEAMSVGKPIITLNNGDTGVFIHNNDNGILIDLSSLKRIPLEMKRLYENDPFREKISKSARRYAEENFWSWEERMNAELSEVTKLLKK